MAALRRVPSSPAKRKSQVGPGNNGRHRFGMNRTSTTRVLFLAMEHTITQSGALFIAPRARAEAPLKRVRARRRPKGLCDRHMNVEKTGPRSLRDGLPRD